MIVESQSQQSNEYIVRMNAEEAAKLRRVLNFNVTVKDRITARDGERDGYSMYHIMAELGNKLKALGVPRWKRQ